VPPAPPPPAPPAPPAPPPPPPPPAPPPPLPSVPASFFLAPGGSDANPCTAAQPCRTFGRAYWVAGPGDVVELAAGTYGDQAVLADPSHTSVQDVVFRPATGATVIVGTKPLATRTKTTIALDIDGAKHITIKDMTIRGDAVASGGAEDVTFDNLTASNGVPGAYAPTTDITFRGGSYGNVINYKAEVYPSGNGTHNVNFTMDGTVLHDVRSTDLAAYHVECILVSDANGAVFRKLKTYNCDVFDLSLGVFSDGVLRNVLVENNFFASTGGTVSSSLGLNTNTTSWNGLTVRNNRSLVYMRHPVCSGGCSNVTYSGNVSPLVNSGQCVAGVVYRYNVWTGTGQKCGGTDKAVGDPLFVNPGAADLHLRAGSPAIDAGDATGAPADDFDGDARPTGAAPDAGADES
jgi:hypothetical protein